MQSTVIQVRRILADLGPAALIQGPLSTAIQRHISLTASPIPIDLKIGQLPPLAPEMEEAAYLVTAEAVTNVLKHARATRARIEVDVNAGHLVVRVADDGAGFQGAQGRGVGLESMRSRAAALGGGCEITTTAAGTTVTFAIPIGGPPT